MLRAPVFGEFLDLFSQLFGRAVGFCLGEFELLREGVDFELKKLC
jgi:hypothetical protein